MNNVYCRTHGQDFVEQVLDEKVDATDQCTNRNLAIIQEARTNLELEDLETDK